MVVATFVFVVLTFLVALGAFFIAVRGRKTPDDMKTRLDEISTSSLGIKTVAEKTYDVSKDTYDVVVDHRDVSRRALSGREAEDRRQAFDDLKRALSDLYGEYKKLPIQDPQSWTHCQLRIRDAVARIGMDMPDCGRLANLTNPWAYTMQMESYILGARHELNVVMEQS